VEPAIFFYFANPRLTHFEVTLLNILVKRLLGREMEAKVEDKDIKLALANLTAISKLSVEDRTLFLSSSPTLTRTLSQTKEIPATPPKDGKSKGKGKVGETSKQKHEREKEELIRKEAAAEAKKKESERRDKIEQFIINYYRIKEEVGDTVVDSIYKSKTLDAMKLVVIKV